MEFENIIYKAGNRFENLIIKSHTIKVIYFIMLQIFTVRFLSILFLIPCQLFSKIQTGKFILQNFLFNLIIPNQLTTFILLILTLLLVTFILYLAIFYDNQLASKISFISLMIAQQSSTLFGIILLTIVQSAQIPLIVKLLSIFVLILIEGISFIIDKVFISYSFQTLNSFSHRNNNMIVISRLIQKMVLYLTYLAGFVFPIQSTISRLFYLSLVVIQILKIKQLIRERYYIDQVSNFLQIFMSIISLTGLSITVAYQFYPNEDLMPNLFVLWPIVSIFACVSVYTYSSQKINSYFFKNIQQVYQKNQTINYLEALYSLWKNTQSDYYSLIVASIRKNHQFQCRKIHCYCHNAKKVQQENNNLMEGNIVFFKGYYQQILTYVDKQNKNNDQKFLKVLYFKFKIFNNCVKIIRQLNKIKCSILSNIQLSMGKKILQNNIQCIYQKYSVNKHQNLKVQLPMQLNNTLHKLQKIVFNDIYVKNKKWSNLGKNFCKTLDIQEEINKQIVNLRMYDEIYDNYKVIYKKSLAFNAISLFYFADISFINKKIQDIQTNLRQLKNLVKYRQVISNKQLSKHILDNRCCLLQFDLSTQQSIKPNELPISNCTKNVKDIFKYQKQLFIHKKLQTLFPKFLFQPQINYFEKILNPNQQLQFSQATDKFFIDRSGYVFESLVNLKIIAQNNGIALMMIVFQKQTKNIMLLNNKGFIQNIGQTFINYFGRIYDGIPFSSFFYFDDQYTTMNFTDKFIKNKFIFINAIQLGDDWLTYLQKIKNYLKKKKYNEAIKHKHQKQLQKQTQKDQQQKRKEENNKNDKQTNQFLRKQKRQLIRSKIITSKELGNLRQTRKTLGPNDLSILSVSLDYRMFTYDDFSFKVIIIDQVKRKKTPTDQTQYTIKSFRQCKDKKPRSRKYEGTLKQIQKTDQQKQLIQELQNQQDVMNSIDLEQQMKIKQRQKQPIYQQASSVKSSMRTSSVSFFYFKFIQTCFNLFKNPSAIVDRRLNTFTFSSLVIACFLSLLIIAAYIVFSLGLYEVKDIFFADGAVSDNMQLTLFMYNRAMNFKQFKDNPTELANIKEAAFFQRQYVFGLQVHDLDRLLADYTSMTNTKFYQYLRVPTKWYFVNPNTPPLTIQSNQFLVYYYQLSRQVQLNILNNTPQAQHTVQNAFKLMMINFPQMKRINHGNLYLYQQMSDQSISLLRNLIVILAISHVILSVILFLLYYRQKIFRRNQIMQGYGIYKVIPQKVVQFIANYYGFYCQQVQNQKDLARFQVHYDRHPLYLPMDQTSMLKLNKNSFSQQKSFFTPAIWKMLLLVMILNMCFGIMLVTIKNLFDPIQLMMKNVNNLMDSQNYLIEAYVDLKAKFIIEQNFTYIGPQFFDDLLQSQLNTQVLFNKISVQSLQLFSNYDQTYKTNFIDLLINNTCDLVQGQVTPEQLQNCRTSLKLNYINNGVITGMNFFTRKVRQIINQFKIKFQKNKSLYNMTSNDKEYVIQTLKSVDFRQIDQSMIFMFKMYQATQARIYISLQNTIIDIMNTSYWIVVIEVLFVGIFYPIFLFFNFKQQKFQLSQLYVSFLLIPTPLARLLKSFSSKIQQILQYQKTQ